MSQRVVVPNDQSGLWEVHQPRGVFLAHFESQSLAQEFAAAPRMLPYVKMVADGVCCGVWGCNFIEPICDVQKARALLVEITGELATT